jgi:4a-hydroxytetrahydrobiopterin dehydratase
MGAMATLSEDDIRTALSDLPGWDLAGGEIAKEYRFPDFVTAMAFVNRLADRAEAVSHHPDLEIHYNRVRVALSTHSEGGITAQDTSLAADIEDLASSGQ